MYLTIMLILKKNWSNVRKLIGWDRYEGTKSQKLLNNLYSANLRIFFNLFMPSVKIIKTQRIGSRYKKIYDMPKTPLTRLYEYDKSNTKINDYIKLKRQIILLI